MSMSGFSGPVRFIYLDLEGLDSLYAQMTKRVETEFESTRERERSGKAQASVGLGKLLGAFAGLADLTATADALAVGRRKKTRRSAVAPEQKLERLRKKLTAMEPPLLFQDLDDASTAARDRRSRVVVQATDLFDLPQFYPGSDGVVIANKMGALLFERNLRPEGAFDGYDHSDQYFRTVRRVDRARIVMTASLEKCCGATQGKMRSSGHDAIYFRQHQGLDVPVGVFGWLYSGPVNCQIKPLAIFL